MRSSIATERLTLRPPTAADAPALAAIWRDPAVARMTAGVPHPQPAIAAEGYILMLEARRPLQREFLFVFDHPDRGVVGYGGAYVGRDGVEIGYALHPEHWGFGFATEAARALTAFAAALGCGPVRASVFLDNPASERVLRKLGFVHTGEPCSLFSLARGGSAPGRRLRWSGRVEAPAADLDLAAAG